MSVSPRRSCTQSRPQSARMSCDLVPLMSLVPLMLVMSVKDVMATNHHDQGPLMSLMPLPLMSLASSSESRGARSVWWRAR